MTDVVGDMGKIVLPGGGNDLQQFFLTPFFGKTPAGHKFRRRAQGNTDILHRRLTLAGLPQMLLLVPAVALTDRAEA